MSKPMTNAMLCSMNLRDRTPPMIAVAENKCPYIYIYIYKNTYIHTYIYRYTYVHINIYTYIHACIHTFIHSFLPSFHSFIHSLIHSFIHSFTHSFIHSFIHTDIHTYIYIYIYIQMQEKHKVSCERFGFYRMVHATDEIRHGNVEYCNACHGKFGNISRKVAVSYLSSPLRSKY